MQGPIRVIGPRSTIDMVCYRCLADDALPAIAPTGPQPPWMPQAKGPGLRGSKRRVELETGVFEERMSQELRYEQCICENLQLQRTGRLKSDLFRCSEPQGSAMLARIGLVRLNIQWGAGFARKAGISWIHVCSCKSRCFRRC
jgi:hypothetical protein